MGTPLARGANVALTRENPSLATVVLGIRWDAGADPVLAGNLVGAAMLCGPDNKIPSDQHFVYFNQLLSPERSVARLEELLGDDQDQIEVDLDAVPAGIERIVVVLYLNEGSTAKRTLGQLRNCSIRILDGRDNRELARSEDLAPGLSAETAIVLGHLYRYRRRSGAALSGPSASGSAAGPAKAEWRFRVVGQGYAAGLEGVAADYGMTL